MLLRSSGRTASGYGGQTCLRRLPVGSSGLARSDPSDRANPFARPLTMVTYHRIGRAAGTLHAGNELTDPGARGYMERDSHRSRCRTANRALQSRTGGAVAIETARAQDQQTLEQLAINTIRTLS